MPLPFSRHSNRSQQLESSKAQQQPESQSPSSPVGIENKGYAQGTPQPLPYSQPLSDPNQYSQQNIAAHGSDISYHEVKSQPDLATQSQHNRQSIIYPSPAVNVSEEAVHTGQYRQESNSGPSSKIASPIEPQKKSKSRFFGSRSSKSHKAQESTSQAQLQPAVSHSLSRKLSGRGHKQPQPQDLRGQQQDSSTEQLQTKLDWQSNPSSGTISSRNQQDEADPSRDSYQIRSEEADHQKGLAYDPRPGLSVRIVDGNQAVDNYQQYQSQQQTLQSPSHYNPQQQQQYQVLSNTTTPISAQHQQDYPGQMPLQQYQQQNPPGYGPHHQQFLASQGAEVASQISRESSQLEQSDDQRPGSMHSGQPQSTAYNNPEYLARTSSLQGARISTQQGSMVPPAQPSSQGRKSTEVNKPMQNDGARHPPQAYGQGSYQPVQQGPPPPNLQNPLPPIPGQQAAGNYRNSVLQREFSQGLQQEQGRHTPPPDNRAENRDSLQSDYDKLILKYKNVKQLYFERRAQVEQLQIELANYRLSQNRTSLDDSEYTTRFQRLDGAIKEIAHGIRKEWKAIPTWLAPFVNVDAMKTGSKEMTAVGRAAISRWIADEIFGRCFHPSLNINLSAELKNIEHNLRFYGPQPTTTAEHETLTTKIVQWRLTTMEGLSYIVGSEHSQEARKEYTQLCVNRLTAYLMEHLEESSAPNIEGNATSIVELAVGIASHLPLESRDIIIRYPLPGDHIQSCMRVEAPLPPLESMADSDNGNGGPSTKKDDNQEDAKAKRLGKSKSVVQRKPEAGTETSGEGKVKDGADKVRFAAFMGVEVRGRQWLINPPVWTIS